MLMIPALPAASYLAEGLAISSIWSMLELGIFFSSRATSWGDMFVGLPSIIMITPFLPRMDILSSLSTCMPGDCWSTSSAVPPAATMLFSTFTTILSAFCSIKGRLPVTFTSFRLRVSSESTMALTFTGEPFTLTGLLKLFSCPCSPQPPGTGLRQCLQKRICLRYRKWPPSRGRNLSLSGALRWQIQQACYLFLIRCRSLYLFHLSVRGCSGPVH